MTTTTMPKMNKWVKRKWVKALRSGEYAQGIGAMMRADGTYCCLGVLGQEMVPEFCKRAFGAKWSAIDGRWWTLPDDLIILWGLDMITQEELARMNDTGWSFRRIATWIERNL